ncbi:MAG: hypothetical protein ACF8NJ_05720 [Phycisphaerales bacterium JB038]
MIFSMEVSLGLLGVNRRSGWGIPPVAAAGAALDQLRRQDEGASWRIYESVDDAWSSGGAEHHLGNCIFRPKATAARAGRGAPRHPQ